MKDHERLAMLRGEEARLEQSIASLESGDRVYADADGINDIIRLAHELSDVKKSLAGLTLCKMRTA